MQRRVEAAMQEAFERAGGRYRLNQRLGLFRTATYQWKRIPRRRLAKLAHITGMTKAEMRPDLYED